MVKLESMVNQLIQTKVEGNQIGGKFNPMSIQYRNNSSFQSFYCTVLQISIKITYTIVTAFGTVQELAAKIVFTFLGTACQ